jgi:hypothetical protein
MFHPRRSFRNGTHPGSTPVLFLLRRDRTRTRLGVRRLRPKTPFFSARRRLFVRARRRGTGIALPFKNFDVSPARET